MSIRALTFRQVFVSLLIALFCTPPVFAASAPGPARLRPKAAAASVEVQESEKKTAAIEAMGAMPMSFEPNLGQTDARVKYLARGRGYTLFLTADGAVLSLAGVQAGEHELGGGDLDERHGTVAGADCEVSGGDEFRGFREGQTVSAAIQIGFVGANAVVPVAGETLLEGKSNYLFGNDPAKWHSDVPNYARVRYENLYPGIDLVYYGAQGTMEYDFVVKPGADPKVIRMKVEGGDSVEVDSAGDLLIGIGDATIRQRRPVMYQETDAGNLRLVTGRYVLGSRGDLTFAVGGHDPTKPLVIDPVLLFSTFLGAGLATASNADSLASSVGVASDGSAFITGRTTAADFPTTLDAYSRSPRGFHDVYVTRLNSTGTNVLYSTYIGGSGADEAKAIAIDAAGAAYITGSTLSPDFMTTPGAYDTTFNANPQRSDAFVLKLNAGGTTIVFSTFVGGVGDESGNGIALGPSGSVFIGGYTDSGSGLTDFTGYDGTYNGGTYDAFVAKLNVSGSTLVYGTFLGGSNWDSAEGIAVNSSGEAFVTGRSDSVSGFEGPLTGYDTTPNGGADAFVAKLNASGGTLVYWTFLGGSAADIARGIAVNSSGEAFVTGVTLSTTGFEGPFTGYDTTPNGSGDAFVTKLNSSGGALIYWTFLGGPDGDNGRAIAVTASGEAIVTGQTRGGFPVLPSSYSTVDPAADDAFLVRMDAAGSNLLYSTYLGGDGTDSGAGVAVTIAGEVVVAGYSESGLTFPVTAGAYDGSPNGLRDIFVTKLITSQSDLEYSTLLGGSTSLSTEDAFDVKVDMSGAVYVCGSTTSIGFPTTSGIYDATLSGGEDIFVTKFDPSGSVLAYSTFLGGSDTDVATCLALTGAGEAVVAGHTLSSAGFEGPLVGLDTTHDSAMDGFVTKLDATGSALQFWTFLGGGGSDFVTDVAVDPAGVFVTGWTSAGSGFPVSPGAYDTTGNNNDAFATQLNASGTAIVYSTLLGGFDDDYGNAIAIDSNRAAYVAGRTSSSFGFQGPLTGYDVTHNGGDDVFVTKINPAGSDLEYWTFLGGSNSDGAKGIAVDGGGAAYVIGSSSSTSGFQETPSGFDPTNNGGGDAFAAKINASGSVLEYFTFLGGSGYDEANGVAVNSAGEAYVAGVASPGSAGMDFPVTVDAFDTSHNGSIDAFVCKLSASGQQLTHSTLFGGLQNDRAYAIAVNAFGGAYICGTAGAGFPVTASAYDPILSGLVDTFVLYYCIGDNEPPMITQQPQGQTINRGQTAMMTVMATSITGTTTYQWYRGESGFTSDPVAGATSAMFTTPPLQSTTKFWCRVTDLCGAFSESASATVTVNRAPYVVSNTGDSGAGSLEQAIVDANMDPGADTITFSFMGAGPHTINLTSALPAITEPVAVDGYSQPGSVVGTPVVVLNGVGAGGTAVMDCDTADMGAGVDGLHFAATAAGSTVRGLVIQNFTGDGIEFEGGGTNTVTGCYIGTNATGTMGAGNGRNGIYLNASANNQIGGDVFAGAGNLISGNHCSGIEIRGSGATSNVIEGCYIGTNAAGTGSIGNQYGIRVDGAPGTLVGSGDDAGRRCRVRGNTGGGVTNTNTGSAPLMTVNTIITGNVIVDNGGGAIVGGAGAVPVVTGATLAGTLLTVTGQTTGVGNTDYDVEYFRNTVCGLGGGQGEEFLAKVRKRSTGAGVLDLSFSSTQTKARPGELIAVTVTGPGGTSNFSLCEVVEGRLSVVARGTAVVNLMGLPSSMGPAGPKARAGQASGPVGESPLFGAASDRVYREEPGRSAVNVGNGFGAEAASPGLSSQFEGLDDNPGTGQAPSDAQGAVGPGHVLTITQLEIAVQAKGTGVYQKRATVDDFFAGIVEMGEPGLVVFNPRAAYDPYWPGGGRWMVAATANGRTAESAVLVAVSQTADPLGDWNVYRYEGDVSEVAWSDYPTLGFTKDWIAIHVNMLTIGSDAFARGAVYLLDKASLYGGTPGTGPGTVLGAIEFATAVPAMTYSATEETLWLMSAGRDEMTQEGLVNVFAVRGSVGGETLTAEGSYVATGGLWDDESPNRVDFAPQMGTVRKIQVNDARLHSVVYRNGRLWCGQTILLPRGGAPARSAVQYWEINPGPTNPGIVQRGVVDDPTGTEFYAYPSIAVNGSGNVVFGYSKFSGTSFAGAAYRYRTAGDGAGVLRDEVMLRTGEAAYDRFPMDARNRWGNYSAAVVDGGGDETLWLLNMYAKQPEMGVDQWGTYWGGIGNVAGCQVTCPGNVTVNAEAGQCGAVVTYSAPTTAGDCQTVSCVPASGTTFGVGVTTVTCTNSGNAAQCSFTVTVVDAQAPTVTCPSNVTTNAAAGQCAAVVTYTTPTASDNCAGATVACAPASGSTFVVGTTTVVCTATDASSNTTQCAFTVTVNDMEAPVIECPATLTAVAGAGACSAPVNFNLSVSDNCPGAISVTTSHPLATAFPVGTTQVTVTATDVSGNSSSCQVMVTVTDVTAPVIGSCAANVTRQAESNAGAAVVYAAPAATDACGASVSCVPASGTTFSVGVTTVTCTATDGSANAAQCEFTVTVEWPADSMGAVNGSGAWFLKDTNGQGGADAVFFFGLGTDAPVVGDYDGDGRDTVGVYRPSTAEYFLKNANTQEAPVALAFQFGGPGFGFVPVMGDWDGNGTATVGFYSPSNGAFFIKNTNAGGDADLIFFFGGASQGRIPIVGDWDGDGRDGIGLYNPAIGSFELKNVVGNGVSDIVFFFGAGGQGYVPVVGDWDNDGRDGVALYSPTAGAYFLKNELTTTGVADRVFFYGPTNARPVAGNWDVRP